MLTKTVGADEAGRSVILPLSFFQSQSVMTTTRQGSREDDKRQEGSFGKPTWQSALYSYVYTRNTRRLRYNVLFGRGVTREPEHNDDRASKG